MNVDSCMSLLKVSVKPCNEIYSSYVITSYLDGLAYVFLNIEFIFLVWVLMLWSSVLRSTLFWCIKNWLHLIICSANYICTYKCYFYLLQYFEPLSMYNVNDIVKVHANVCSTSFLNTVKCLNFFTKLQGNKTEVCYKILFSCLYRTF